MFTLRFLQNLKCELTDSYSNCVTQSVRDTHDIASLNQIQQMARKYDTQRISRTRVT